MVRFWGWALLGVAMLLAALPLKAQDASPLAGYFLGKQVTVKLDMPGTQKGIDLSYNKPAAMDWNDYSSRLKTFGIAIPKGSGSRVTKFVVKKDMIEFQLDGGGFGTSGDDTNTTVSPTLMPKSQYEKDLEKQISGTSDAKRKRDLQSDLDHERTRRERIDAVSRNEALVASQMKAQQVADKRLHGGSRFNLRWKGAIPSDDLNPDAIMRLLAEYVDFGTGTPTPAVTGSHASAGLIERDATTQVKRGMRIDELEALLGKGQLISQSTSPDGMKTQVLAYTTADSVMQVTLVEGVVVRYSMQSN